MEPNPIEEKPSNEPVELNTPIVLPSEEDNL